MSQFDFPRIHVRGLVSINVGTANNDDYSGMSIVPTRTANDEPKMAAYDRLPMRLANTDDVQPITFGKSDKGFIKWASRPLEVFNGATKTKVIPGEWNYNGSMGMALEFNYKDFEGNSGTSQTIVSRIQTDSTHYFNEETGTDGLSEAQLAALNPFIGATLSYKKRTNVRESTAMMIDCSQEGSSASSQVIAGNLMLENKGNILLGRQLNENGNYAGGGQPSKASTWWLNFQRNVNFPGPGGAAGTFQTVVPFEPGLEATALKELFETFRPAGETREIVGVVYRYALFRVQSEFRNNLTATELQTKAGKAIPGLGEMIGTLAPWYEGDGVENLTMGRILMPLSYTMGQIMAPYPQGNPPRLPGTFVKPTGSAGNGGQFRLGPIVSKLHEQLKVLSLDMATSVPENYTDDPRAKNFPGYRNDTDPSISKNPKYNLGDLDLGLRFEDANGTEQEVTLATLNFDDSSTYSYGTVQYNDGGAMLDISLDCNGYTLEDVKQGTLFLKGTAEGQSEQFLNEQELMITFPHSTVYCEQEPSGTTTLYNFAGDQVPSPVVVYQKGKPLSPAAYEKMVQSGKGLVLQQFRLNPLQLQESVNEYPILNQDINTLDFSVLTDVNLNGTHIGAITQKGVSQQEGGMITTQGEIDTIVHPIVYVRILPNEDYSQYYEDPSAEEPVGNDTLTFGVIYEKVFRNYHLIYPAMNQQVPMNDPMEWAGPTMARTLLDRIDPTTWMDYAYMPRTRDLSHSRTVLLQAYARRILKNPAKFNTQAPSYSRKHPRI